MTLRHLANPGELLAAVPAVRLPALPLWFQVGGLVILAAVALTVAWRLRRITHGRTKFDFGRPAGKED